MERMRPYELPLSGAHGPEEEDRLRQILFERFYGQFDGRPEKNELVKTPERFALIDAANAAIQAYFRNRSLTVPEIPQEIIHFLIGKPLKEEPGNRTMPA